MDGKRLIRLDSLRFVAAIAVVFFHFAFRGAAAGDMPVLDLPTWLVEASKYSYLGVNLFFMISGFVIAFSAEGRSPIDFGAARLARLYPSYIAAMTLTFLVTLFFGAPLFSTSIAQYLANFSMLAPAFGQGLMDGAYWSIVLEIIFYGWVFVLLLTGQYQKSCERIILIWLIISLLNEFFLQLRPVRFVFLTEFAGFFAAGILIYRWRAGLSSFSTLPLLALSLGVSLQTSMNSLPVLEANYQTSYSHGLVIALVIALYGLFFAATSARPSRVPRRLLLSLGAITYPLYLIHQHIGYIALARLKGSVGDPLLLLGVVLALLAAATAIWLVIDRPLVPAMRKGLILLANKLVRTTPHLGRYLTRLEVVRH